MNNGKESETISKPTLFQRAIRRALDKADVQIGGSRSGDITVNDPKFYRDVFMSGALGLGESYMDGSWDSDRVDLFIEKILRSGNYANDWRWPACIHRLKGRLFNQQTRTRSRDVVEQHYDQNFELYQTFLDPYNQYTVGYFRGTDDLNEAQEKKLELICKKLQLKKSDRVLDIGCGWGGFAKYAAEKYGCEVVGITLSDEQLRHAKELTQELPVEIRQQDYRDLRGEKFDKIAAIGVVEHVGYKNYREFMEVVHASLNEDGIFFVDTIGQKFSSTAGDPWTNKYIFPGGMLPSLEQLAEASKGLFIQNGDVEDLDQDYYKTLRAWDDNFQRNWSPQIASKYPENFYRMFRYYFNSFAGAFKAERIHDWHIVYNKVSEMEK